MAYSRQSPSPRFTELLGYYGQLHDEGDARLDMGADEMFDGRSLSVHISTIRSLVKRFGSKTLLDYGAGKAKHYEDTVFKLPSREVKGLKALWGLDAVRLYDPGYAPYAALPDGTFDAVICTDVLEHIPEEDMDWVVGELFDYARHFVYAGVATYPAGKILPNGMNAHVTLRSTAWWDALFRRVRAQRQSAAEFVVIVERIYGDENPERAVSFG